MSTTLNANKIILEYENRLSLAKLHINKYFEGIDGVNPHILHTLAELAVDARCEMVDETQVFSIHGCLTRLLRSVESERVDNAKKVFNEIGT